MKIIKLSFLSIFVIFLFTQCSVEDDPNTPTPNEVSLEIQPNAEDGLDAIIWSSDPDKRMGYYEDFQVMGWTWNSLGLEPGVRRSLIKFDLSEIPSGVVIIEANLELFYNEFSPDIPSTSGHSTRDGSNESVLKRITSDWDETRVTWNTQPSTTDENQIILRESISPTEDYQIDVTDHINDMFSNKESNHGFMFSLRNEDYYRAMIFASSDHDDESLHPKLVVKYIER